MGWDCCDESFGNYLLIINEGLQWNDIGFCMKVACLGGWVYQKGVEKTVRGKRKAKNAPAARENIGGSDRNGIGRVPEKRQMRSWRHMIDTSQTCKRLPTCDFVIWCEPPLYVGLPSSFSLPDHLLFFLFTISVLII